MKELILAMNQLREQTPANFETRKAKGSEIWPYYKNGKSKERVIIFLRSSGCEWVKRSGGCTMCQHAWEGTTQGKKIDVEDFIIQFNTEIEKYVFSEQLSGLCIFNEGNFFNENELPIKARRHIIDFITKSPQALNISDVTFETLPEYMTQEGLNDIREIVESGRCVTVGIGLESSNPLVRKIINKPFSLKTYEKGVRAIQETGAKVLAYILVKPPFLTEYEALVDSMNTVKYAFEVGTDIVSLEPINIGKFTIAGKLHEKGLYRAPWLWSILQTLHNVYTGQEIRIGGAQYKPNYQLVPHNCPKCNDKFLEIIDNWNKNQAMHVVTEFMSSPVCFCRLEWCKDLRIKDLTPLENRPAKYL